MSPLGYVSFGAMIHTQDTKFEWPFMQSISVKAWFSLQQNNEELAMLTVFMSFLIGLISLCL